MTLVAETGTYKKRQLSGHRDTPCEKGTSGHPIQDLSVEAAVGQYLRCCGCLLLRSAKNLNRPKDAKKKNRISTH